MKEVGNILRIFREAKTAMVNGDPHDIKRLSGQTIHSATISQDPDNVVIAVLIYAVGKILERENYKEMPGWKEFYKVLIQNWDLAIKALENNDVDGFRVSIGKIRNSINKIDEDLSVYIRDVFNKAEINKAFKIYEHGLSSEQTATMLGVNLWDLASYIGQSSISEAKVSETMDVKERIKTAEEIFG